jgi:hypothetical protein
VDGGERVRQGVVVRVSFPPHPARQGAKTGHPRRCAPGHRWWSHVTCVALRGHSASAAARRRDATPTSGSAPAPGRVIRLAGCTLHTLSPDTLPCTHTLARAGPPCAKRTPTPCESAALAATARVRGNCCPTESRNLLDREIADFSRSGRAPGPHGPQSPHRPPATCSNAHTGRTGKKGNGILAFPHGLWRITQHGRCCVRSGLDQQDHDARGGGERGHSPPWGLCG